ncbi:MAG TPA: (deoxy)nucleoside triphosphate pyrophosphohydrolase [Candidatus Omnitrophota bacterium]|nr:(deoxy)nucleoside triphosphate pyrophosphohydrolase [Candidatus Omnitrophota bacterium]
MNPRETIDVGCAMIHKNGQILIAQRHLEDSFGGYWEFPGGKREEGETIEDCLKREVFEELGIRIHPERFWGQREHGTPERKIRLFFYFCRWEKGEPAALDCKDFKWVSQQNIRQYPLLPGDVEVLEDLICHWAEYLSGSSSRP